MVFRQGLNVTMLHCYIVTFCPLSAKSNTRGPKITASRARNYGSFKIRQFLRGSVTLIKHELSAWHQGQYSIICHSPHEYCLLASQQYHYAYL